MLNVEGGEVANFRARVSNAYQITFWKREDW